ncbi:MAG: flagellar motor protein MotB [Tissierellaceae bacterium]
MRRNNENEGGAPKWMVTYSDMMSLLLTFFILLFSMSTISSDKFDNIMSSFQNILSGSKSDSILYDGDNLIDLHEELIQTEEMYDKVSDYLEDQDLGSDVSVSMDSKGIFVEMKDAILFESGRAELKPEGIEVLKKLEGLISDFDNELVIEGHTDNVPMTSGRFPSNWELSTARAVTVVRYLSESLDIDPGRLSAVGYGEYRPIKPNDTAENRAANRRVNILIIFNEESEN